MEIKTKEKWIQIMKPEMMSSEESEEEAIVVRPLTYRSPKVNRFLKMVDESITEHKTPQAKRQRKNRTTSDTPSLHSCPSETSIPKWAFSS